MMISVGFVYAPSLGHPARLSGREEVMRHVTWFLSQWRTSVFSTCEST